MLRPILAMLLVASFAASSTAVPPPEALELRNLGLAELENERPPAAEEHYRRLVELLPEEPLGHANLAIALLRRQHLDEGEAAIDRALELAPGRADLLAIKGEIFVWSGAREEALATLSAAHDADPDDLEIAHALYRQATAMRGDEAERQANRALLSLADLRPENLYVLLKLGQYAVANNDRALATRSFLRVRELVWRTPGLPQQQVALVLEALERNDLEAAGRPAFIVENVLKQEAMFQNSLRELTTGIQGVPVARFVDEPEQRTFGAASAIRFRGSTLDPTAGSGRALVVADLDGDSRPDIARVSTGDRSVLELRLSRDQHAVSSTLSARAVTGLQAIDLDNDGAIDLVGYGERIEVWKGNGQGGFEEATEAFFAEGAEAHVLAAFDYDSEGDLDLAAASSATSGIELFRNALEGPLQPLGPGVITSVGPTAIKKLSAGDLDRDGDLDLYGVAEEGAFFLDNLRQGRFADRTTAAGLDQIGTAHDLLSVDLDNDGLPDLISASTGLRFWRNRGHRFEPWEVRGDIPRTSVFNTLLDIDADNDGRMDIVAAGAEGLIVLTQPKEGIFLRTTLENPIQGAILGLGAGDLDLDGDIDLVATGPGGLYRLENFGGNQNRWLEVSLVGLDKGNGKNNLLGLGAQLEIFAGDAYQYREVTSQVSHIGLGEIDCPDLLRVTWTNGVPQNRIRPCDEQRIVEEQVLKGSCPFLYTETGEGVRFVTDLLWGAPLGMPVAEGVWAGYDMTELVRVDGASERDGSYDLRITEELWEAAFFDLTRLWVVDHPAELEVASSLRIIPGESVEDRVLATAGVRPLKAAWDGLGEDVTTLVRDRDEVYADGYAIGAYQGVARKPWTFTLDLGAAPAGSVRLLLDGWIFPADASLNLAIDQRQRKPILTRLEMKTEAGWKVLMPKMGHPAGKTKTMVIDTPPLPPNVHQLRIVTSRWLHWDRIAWSTAPRDEGAKVIARLDPTRADLHFRGFSSLTREAPNAPHGFDYTRVSSQSPWLALEGNYTRYGDVRELLIDDDDRQVILAAGDELSLRFDAAELPPLATGWRRTVFLESHGWDKDADRNTWEADQMEPLPFRAMGSYPYPAGTTYPETPELRRYRQEWLTRKVESPTRGRPRSAVLESLAAPVNIGD